LVELVELVGIGAALSLGADEERGQAIKRHLWGILNAVVLKSHNGHSESMNSRIQRIKPKACGFRSRERCCYAIYSHCGGLDLYPKAIST
jgi:transposase